MIRRETVRSKHWLTEDEYLDLVALGNLLPGSNPINIAVLIGMHIRGAAGAATAFFCSVLPGFAVLMVLGIIALDTHLPWTSGFLAGCAAVAVGTTAASTIEMSIKRVNPIEIALIVIVACAVLFAHLSLAWTLIIFIPIALVALGRPKKAST